MGLPELPTGQFTFSLQHNKKTTLQINLPEEGKMIITIPSLISAGIATAVVTGEITGTAVYLTAGDADVVTGDQIKTEGGLHILELGHMEPWAIAMICATVLIGMGTCGACCHRQGKSYVRDKEAKLRDRALGRAKELVHMKAHGAEKLLEDVQTYHDMHDEIVVQKMHQITPPRTTGGVYAERPCGNPQCSECRKPRHMVVGFSNAEQKATIMAGADTEVEDDKNWAAPIHPQAEWDDAESPSPAESSPPRSIAARTPLPPRSTPPPRSRSPSPPRSIATRTPLPPTVVDTPNNPFADEATNALFISPHLGNWDPIRDGNQVTQEDYNRHAERSIECMLEKQRRQNNRDMQNIPRDVARKNSAKQYARERFLARQEEQKQRRIFSDLQEQENKKKLRRPFDRRNYTSVPMGLPLTSEEWMRDSATWHEENEEKRIIDVVSDDDMMEAYYFEGKKLCRILKRRHRRTDETYEREDRDLAASLSRNAAAAAAATDAWE
jgi:hypothetical protein